LQDLPRHVRLDRLLHGTPGLRKDWWVELSFGGRLGGGHLHCVAGTLAP
jgi:hypothetical protein